MKMKWLPAWLGKAYCTLYQRIEGTFTVRNIAGALNVSAAKANLIASRLAQAGWLKRLEKGKYRVVEPKEILERITIWGEIERNLARVPQREFISPLKRFLEAVVGEYGGRLVSAALFGSVARGDADPTSDLDVLLVIEGLPKGLPERQEEITELVLSSYKKRSPVEPLVPVSPVLYTPSEALGFHSIYLDMTRHCTMLFDPRGLLRKKITEFSEKLEDLGSQRLEVLGKPVWVLKPDLRRGEVVELG